MFAASVGCMNFGLLMTLLTVVFLICKMRDPTVPVLKLSPGYWLILIPVAFAIYILVFMGVAILCEGVRGETCGEGGAVIAGHLRERASQIIRTTGRQA